MEEALTAAARLLTGALLALERPVPERIPLRLRGEAGLLLSALPRQCAGPGEEPCQLARALAERADLSGTPFSDLRAENGLLLLSFSQDWLRWVLAFYAGLPWPEPKAQTGLRRQDGGEPAFLREYTLRRCRVLAGRTGEAAELPVGLLCLLAQGPGNAPEQRSLEILRRYWRLPAKQRHNPLLAGAAGRAAGWNFS
ncbi:MAG: hypothetical protein ACI3U8_08110 [Candidatus Onthomonas sp.]